MRVAEFMPKPLTREKKKGGRKAATYRAARREAAKVSYREAKRAK